MRSRLIALGAVAGLLALSGCAEEPAPEPLPPVRVVTAPAASAGGACILWNWQFIEDYLGVRFSVAAGRTVSETSTCVVRTEAPEPVLMLTVVSRTSIDAGVFADELVPDKATRVKGLGLAGYRLASKATKAEGPTVEVGWLSQARQIQTLTYTLPRAATRAEITDMTGRMVAMAQAMTTVDGEPTRDRKKTAEPQ